MTATRVRPVRPDLKAKPARPASQASRERRESPGSTVTKVYRGEQGPAAEPLMWKEAGTYDPAKVYARLDWVRFNGCSWICGANQKAPSAPPGADWSLIAQKGPRGAVGQRGETGSPGRDGRDGTNGVDGRHAPAIIDARVLDNGSLAFTDSEGQTIEATGFGAMLRREIAMAVEKALR
jgi:hypothetical protein